MQLKNLKLRCKEVSPERNKIYVRINNSGSDSEKY